MNADPGAATQGFHEQFARPGGPPPPVRLWTGADHLVEDSQERLAQLGAAVVRTSIDEAHQPCGSETPCHAVDRVTVDVQDLSRVSRRPTVDEVENNQQARFESCLRATA